MTDDRAASIQARLAAATPGPWEARGRLVFFATGTNEHSGGDYFARYGISVTGEIRAVAGGLPPGSQADATAAFISAAPADIDWLLQERDRLRAALAKVQGRAWRCLEDGHTMQADMDDIAGVADKALREES